MTRGCPAPGSPCGRWRFGLEVRARPCRVGTAAEGSAAGPSPGSCPRARSGDVLTPARIEGHTSRRHRRHPERTPKDQTGPERAAAVLDRTPRPRPARLTHAVLCGSAPCASSLRACGPGTAAGPPGGGLVCLRAEAWDRPRSSRPGQVVRACISSFFPATRFIDSLCPKPSTWSTRDMLSSAHSA